MTPLNAPFTMTLGIFHEGDDGNDYEDDDDEEEEVEEEDEKKGDVNH